MDKLNTDTDPTALILFCQTWILSKWFLYNDWVYTVSSMYLFLI